MKCAWQALINILPAWLRESVDRDGRESLLELRLRLGHLPQLILKERSIFLQQTVSLSDIQYCLNCASQYSPWTSTGLVKGFITAPGGHRIGICGEAVVKNGEVCGISPITSACIRVARDFCGISKGIPLSQKSILIIGSPGVGKTTLLRDLIRSISDTGHGCVAVVDEKHEIFPVMNGTPCFPVGKCTDILSGCSKVHGIEMVLRNMGPAVIAVDEITSSEDTQALMNAGWCGVKLLATAHASGLDDLNCRKIYAPLIEKRLFDHIVILHKDKSWTIERMN